MRNLTGMPTAWAGAMLLVSIALPYHTNSGAQPPSPSGIPRSGDDGVHGGVWLLADVQGPGPRGAAPADPSKRHVRQNRDLSSHCRLPPWGRLGGSTSLWCGWRRITGRTLMAVSRSISTPTGTRLAGAARSYRPRPSREKPTRGTDQEPINQGVRDPPTRAWCGSHAIPCREAVRALWLYLAIS